MSSLTGNFESIKVTEKPEKSNLLGWLFCFWSLNGLVRNLIPNFSELLYFVHVPVILLIILKVQLHRDLKLRARAPSWILASVFSGILTWQTLNGIIGERQFVYVFLFYIFGTFSIPFVASFVSLYGISAIARVLPYLVFINLIFSLNQVIFKNTLFFLNKVNDAPQLGTSRAVLRATGTFTSPGVFALFVSISLAITLWSLKEARANKYLYLSTALALGFMLVISGSRSLLVFIFLAITSSLIFSGFHSIRLLASLLVVASVPIYLSINTSLASRLGLTVYAFYERIQIASSQEDTSQRIWNAFFGFINRLENQGGLFGEGLGSRTNAILGYRSPNWIEEELTRVTVEGGSIAGLLFFIFRWWLFLLILLKLVKTREIDNRFFLSLLFGSYVPTLLVGSITGQGSISVYFILATGILIGLSPNSRANFLLKENQVTK